MHFRYLRQLELFASIICFLVGLVLIFLDIYEHYQEEVEKAVVEEVYQEPEEAEAALAEAEAESRVVSREKGTTVESILMEARVKKGETLEKFLIRNNIELTDRQGIIKSILKYFSPRLIMPGHRFYFRKIRAAGGKEGHKLQKVIFILSNNKKLIIERNNLGEFRPVSPPVFLKKKVEYKYGTVEDNLYGAAIKAGLTTSIISQLTRIYSYSIDFQRAIGAGDTFEVLVEKPVDEETAYEGQGEVVYAALFISGGPLKLFRYTLKDGSVEYFSEKGEGARKALLKTPIKGARISSTFGKRHHPVQGYTKMHRGVDFSAPLGTPIIASGNGVVKKIGRLRGFGNYVFIQHNRDYGTAYAHLHCYAKNLRQGKLVKQGDIIGYVGMTGVTTGPHLHYELHYRGKQINPQSVNMASQRQLAGKPLENFLAFIRKIEQKVKLLKKHPEKKSGSKG